MLIAGFNTLTSMIGTLVLGMFVFVIIACAVIRIFMCLFKVLVRICMAALIILLLAAMVGLL